MTHLKIGDKAPHFSGKNAKNEIISLDQFVGRKLVLYFYPKDDTSGCTAESCNLRDNYDSLKTNGYEIVGVSPDSEKSHEKFIQKYALPFDLIADTDKAIATNYGVWVEKTMYGKQYMGIARTTFIIDEQGVIEKIIDKVKTSTHSAQIL